MKHLKQYELFGFGPKEGDEFIERLIEIIEEEKVDIRGTMDYDRGGNKYYQFAFVIDGIEYEVYDYVLRIFDTTKAPDVINYRISHKYFKEIKRIWQQQEKEKKIAATPDISELGRAAKKYNL